MVTLTWQTVISIAAVITAITTVFGRYNKCYIFFCIKGVKCYCSYFGWYGNSTCFFIICQGNAPQRPYFIGGGDGGYPEDIFAVGDDRKPAPFCEGYLFFGHKLSELTADAVKHYSVALAVVAENKTVGV